MLQKQAESDLRRQMEQMQEDSAARGHTQQQQHLSAVMQADSISRELEQARSEIQRLGESAIVQLQSLASLEGDKQKMAMQMDELLLQLEQSRKVRAGIATDMFSSLSFLPSSSSSSSSSASSSSSSSSSSFFSFSFFLFKNTFSDLNVL